MISSIEEIPRLQQIDGRWHCEGRGIHAGTGMELLCPDGHWLPVRVESRDTGRRLVAYFSYHGLGIAWPLDESNRLRWPESW